MMIWIISGALLIYTAARTVSLVQSTLPEGSQIFAFAALFALDFGLIAWLHFATHGARGSQRLIAVLMVVVDLAGISAAVIADTMRSVDPVASADTIRIAAMFMIPIIVVLNIAATVATSLLSPDQKIRDAKRALADELELSMAAHMSENADAIAAKASPEAAQHQIDNVVSKFLSTARGSTGDKASRGNGTQPMQQMSALSDVDAPIVEDVDNPTLDDLAAMSTRDRNKILRDAGMLKKAARRKAG